MLNVPEDDTKNEANDNRQTRLVTERRFHLLNVAGGEKDEEHQGKEREVEKQLILLEFFLVSIVEGHRGEGNLGGELVHGGGHSAGRQILNYLGHIQDIFLK